MELTKQGFCKEAKEIIGAKALLLPDSENYPIFLNFLINELKELPFDNIIGETICMREDAKEVVDSLVQYLTCQSERIKSKKDWNPDLTLISKIYEIQFNEVFKNIIHPNMGIEGICYSLDLATDANDKPLSFTLDRYFVKSRKTTSSVFRRGCIDLFYTGKMKVFTYQDRWN